MLAKKIVHLKTFYEYKTIPSGIFIGKAFVTILQKLLGRYISFQVYENLSTKPWEDLSTAARKYRKIYHQLKPNWTFFIKNVINPINLLISLIQLKSYFNLFYISIVNINQYW